MLWPERPVDPWEYLRVAWNHYMQPFHLKDALIFVEEGPLGKVIRITVQSLPNDPFILDDKNVLRFAVSSPDFFYQDLAIQAAKFFSALPKPPIGDNIVLSEN